MKIEDWHICEHGTVFSDFKLNESYILGTITDGKKSYRVKFGPIIKVGKTFVTTEEEGKIKLGAINESFKDWFTSKYPDTKLLPIN